MWPFLLPQILSSHLRIQEPPFSFWGSEHQHKKGQTARLVIHSRVPFLCPCLGAKNSKHSKYQGPEEEATSMVS